MYNIGIDTSCYTTSLAVLDADGQLVIDSRKLLKVKTGERGLRQSDGLFQHIVNLEEMVSQLDFAKGKIKSVTASKKPRNEDGSYMPVFRGGSLAGSFLAAGSNGKYYELSHQEGHLFSALWSLRNLVKLEELDRFMFFHISGGTTELLLVERQNDVILAEDQNDIRYKLTKIGGSTDLNSGQFIDRVGVASGLDFPCGAEMDQILQKFISDGIKHNKVIMDKKINLRITIKGSEFSFSGPETQAVRLIESGEEKEHIFKSVFDSIERALGEGVINAGKKYGISKIVVSGGVAANSFIREGLTKRLCKEKINVLFPDIKYASDNAVGNAYFGLLMGNFGLLMGNKVV